MTYRYLQGIDYGPRKGTLGLSFHMSEGYDGLPQYLARKTGESDAAWRDRVNGVSCHVAIQSNGTVWQMLKWDRACGNLNPNDRAGEYGYYGGSHLRAVLGAGWTDPNAYTLSVELAGFRAKGPTDLQVKAAIQWGLEMRAMFPTIRGAVGHHDQSPKECPGLTPNMKAIFEGVGGHGLWSQEDEEVVIVDRVPYPAPKPATGVNVTGWLPDGRSLKEAAWTGIVTADASVTRDDGKAPKGSGFVVAASRPFTGYLIPKASLSITEPPAPTPDCGDAIAAELERAADRAHDAVLAR